MIRRGAVRPGVVRFGTARRGLVWYGEVRRGKEIAVWLGVARYGLA